MKEESMSRKFATAIEKGFPRLLWSHIAHERRDARERMRVAAMGAKAGIPDYLFFDPFEADGQIFRGLALELKAESGRVAASQTAWLEGLAARGWRSILAWSLDDAIDAVASAYSSRAKPQSRFQMSLLVDSILLCCSDGPLGLGRPWDGSGLWASAPTATRQDATDLVGAGSPISCMGFKASLSGDGQISSDSWHELGIERAACSSADWYKISIKGEQNEKSDRLG
jgi:hypothetical protein